MLKDTTSTQQPLLGSQVRQSCMWCCHQWASIAGEGKLLPFDCTHTRPSKKPLYTTCSVVSTHHLEGKHDCDYCYHYSRARRRCWDQVPVVPSAVQTNTWCVHALGSMRDKGNIISMPMNWGTLRLSNLPKVTQEVSGRAGNWTQISSIAGQDFNRKAIFRLSVVFFFFFFFFFFPPIFLF